MSDVLCLGEILVDWVCTEPGADLQDALCFTKAPGGAPANTAVGLARQGVKSAFVGRVSQDEFGTWLRAVLQENGVDVSCTVFDPEAQTRMAYVVTTASGDRKLAEFSRIACADTRLLVHDINEDMVQSASFLHFGSISLLEEPARTATKHAVTTAKKHGLIVSYDPNVRLNLWPSKEVCRQTILDSLSWANMVKINEDELEFLTGSRDFSAADSLRKEKDISLLIITLDSRGAYFTCRQGSKQVPGFSIDLVEATGAGDGFNAGIIAGMLKEIRNASDRVKTLDSMNIEDLVKIVWHANAIGALTCTKKGAIPALPTREELEHFTQTNSAAVR